MHPLDIAALVVYLASLVGIGLWVSRRVKSLEEFVMPRRFGKVLMVSFSFGTGTHADEAVGVSSKTFTNGLSSGRPAVRPDTPSGDGMSPNLSHTL